MKIVKLCMMCLLFLSFSSLAAQKVLYQVQFKLGSGVSKAFLYPGSSLKGGFKPWVNKIYSQPTGFSELSPNGVSPVYSVKLGKGGRYMVSLSANVKFKQSGKTFTSKVFMGCGSDQERQYVFKKGKINVIHIKGQPHFLTCKVDYKP